MDREDDKESTAFWKDQAFLYARKADMVSLKKDREIFEREIC